MSEPGFNNLTRDLADEKDRDMHQKSKESVADDSLLEEKLEPDLASLDVFDDAVASASSLSDDMAESLAVSDAAIEEPSSDVSKPAAEAFEQPAVLSAFVEVERRIKLVVQEKKQLIKERDGLQQQLEDAGLKITDLEEKIDDLLLIEEKYRSFTDQQEMVRTKVENLLSLLETEED